MRKLLLILLLAVTARAETIVFRNVRVFDGTKMLSPRDVAVQDGKIAGIGRLTIDGARVIDGTGKTLLPGLIDSHTHAWGDALRTALAFGVTTELDMFTTVDFLKTAKKEQAEGQANGRADLFSAGTLVTAPGGHGTEYGMVIPTITRPEDAQAFVDARIAEGSDYIKIVLDDGHVYGIKFNTLDKPTLKAVVDAAHARKKLAVVHVGSLDDARAAIDASADALVHLFVDQPPDAKFGRDAAARTMFVIPTLTVKLSVTGTPGAGSLVDDERIAPYLTKSEIETLKRAFPARKALDYTNAERAVRQLKAAKVPILAGTDAGNPGTSHGAALHRELELLVKAGLTPVEALIAATSAPARAFQLRDRGEIALGKRADLVLVHGDPSNDITATRDIAGIWKNGVELDRAAFAKSVADANAAFGAKPAAAGPVVSDFNGGSMATSFGAGWSVTTDSIAGGKSIANLEVRDGALDVRGTIVGSLPYAWAGAMFSPGTGIFVPADLSEKQTLRFRAKGDGKTYRLMMFRASKGYTPSMETFVAGSDWSEHSFALADVKDVTAIIVAAGPAPGEFSIQIDDVRIE